MKWLRYLYWVTYNQIAILLCPRNRIPKLYIQPALLPFKKHRKLMAKWNPKLIEQEPRMRKREVDFSETMALVKEFLSGKTQEEQLMISGCVARVMGQKESQ